MELSIDTATRYAAVAISSKGEMVMELAWRSERNHSVELVPAIRRLMDQAGVAMGDIDGILVARGPGGFSALRVTVRKSQLCDTPVRRPTELLPQSKLLGREREEVSTKCG